MSTDDARQVTGTPLLAHRAGSASARPKNTDRPSSAAPGSVDRLLDQLDMEAAVGCGWWETDTAAVVTGLVSAGAAAVVFTVIAHLLREGEDPRRHRGRHDRWRRVRRQSGKAAIYGLRMCVDGVPSTGRPQRP